MQSNKKRSRKVFEEQGSSSMPVAFTGGQSRCQSSHRSSMLRTTSRVRAAQSSAFLAPVVSQLSSETSLVSPLYMDLGNCDCICEFCGALFGSQRG
ncbi:hypothetical protein QVD17_19311 [Tagetes erecta]|uniref:Uncharacterized protein n=1 Tax=Tagetes erecta TaxID=13708 RepID=A0AAD8KQR5_TARER|nr:hypothetical protein QVD17_19311 [Tagetes erecta]